MLKKKSVIERASVLNSNEEGAMVLAATQPALTGKEEIAAYVCQACNAEFASNQDSEPFCVNCGSAHVHAAEENPLPEVPQTDDDLVAVQCRNLDCETFNVVHASVARNLSGIMHCVTCGSVLAYDNEFNDGGDTPADTRPTEGTPGTPADTRPPEGNPGTPADTRPEDGKSQVDVVHAGEKRPWRQLGGEDFDFDDEPEMSAPGDQQQQQQQQGDPDDVDVSLVTPLDNDPATEQSSEPSEPVEPDAVQVDDTVPACDIAMTLASVVLANHKTPTFEVAMVGESMYAMLQGVHVATLARETAGENADVIHTAAFARAVKQSVQTAGFKPTMKQFGFKAVMLKFPQDKVNAAVVEKRVKETAGKYSERAAEIREDFEQCVALAASGLNRNFFTKRQNVLKKGFQSALAAAGVHSPERLVAGVFDRYGDDYHRELFAVASDLMSKSVEVRNELAAAIQQVSPAAQLAGEQDEQDDQATQQGQEPETLEARLEASVRPSMSPQPGKTATLASVSSITSLREATGGSLFSR